MLDTTFDQWLLSLKLDHKLNLMRFALLEDKPGHFMQLMGLYLEQPINKGGISTDTLQQAFGPSLNDPNFYTNGELFDFKEQRPLALDA